MIQKFRNGCTLGFALAGMIVLFASAIPVSAQVVINELVTDPRQDWNDSEGGDGTAFNIFPGSGTVNLDDQWIELLNVSAQTIDFTSWSLEMIDTAPATEAFTSGSPTLIFSTYGTFDSFGPGARMIVGNPAGEMDHDVYLVLRDGTGAIADAVEFGPTDYAGDGLLNNAPSGRSRDFFDESVARRPDGTDTGQPQYDFYESLASIGQGNPRPLPPPILRINEVVTDPQQDWNGRLSEEEVRNMLIYATFTPDTILKQGCHIYQVIGASAPIPFKRPLVPQRLVIVEG